MSMGTDAPDGLHRPCPAVSRESAPHISRPCRVCGRRGRRVAWWEWFDEDLCHTCAAWAFEAFKRGGRKGARWTGSPTA